MLSPYRYYIGQDLGQSRDPTATCCIRKHGYGDKARYEVCRLNRHPLNTSYVDIVANTVAFLGSEEIQAHFGEFAVDFTGVGRPTADIYQRFGVHPTLIAFTAGNQITRDPDNFRVFGVPKLELISALQSIMHTKQLVLDKTLGETERLLFEMQNFEAHITAAGRYTFGNNRVGQHDDLIMSLAIAAFVATGRHGPSTGIIDYYRNEAARMGADASPFLAALRR